MTPNRVIAIALILLSLSLFALAADSTFTGVIGDAMCGRKHTMAAGHSDVWCTRECAKAGSKYTLITKDKVYTLEGKKEQIDPLAGKKATVKGSLNGDTIQVGSIAAAK